MRFAKKIVIAVDLNRESSLLLKPLRDMNFLLHSEIHFVHVFNTVNYSVLVSEFPLIYPVEADRKVIKDAMLTFLTQTSKEVLPQSFSGRIITECLFDDNPKARLCDYVKETGTDLIIIPTRIKRGIFHSSFAQYVNTHTEVNMLLLK